MNMNLKAILWDFGGVFTTSPFEAFARFEKARDLPENFIRTVNSQNYTSNAWARFESSQISREEFDDLYEQESGELGHPIRGEDVLSLLSGQLRPRMVEALKTCKKHYRVGCITNNMKPAAEQEEGLSVAKPSEANPVLGLFDVVVESSVEGVRKPDPRIYEITCRRLDCAPSECVFLDDLGVNLKPARAMGMFTIKVEDPDVALEELADVTGLEFR